ncbi:MAG: phage holin family protein [Dermatophilus congolensis]|nr:phage holin family protein [Dermatophilus congolensis]
MQFLVRMVVIAIAVAAAAMLVPGIAVTGSSSGAVLGTLAFVALIIGFVNAFVKPVVTFVTGCLVVVTFGLFLFVINAWMLMLSASLASALGLGFTVNGFGSALLGSIVITFVTWLLSGVFGLGKDRNRA